MKLGFQRTTRKCPKLSDCSLRYRNYDVKADDKLVPDGMAEMTDDSERRVSVRRRAGLKRMERKPDPVKNRYQHRDTRRVWIKGEKRIYLFLQLEFFSPFFTVTSTVSSRATRGLDTTSSVDRRLSFNRWTVLLRFVNSPWKQAREITPHQLSG